jgi:hypothetical protein
MQRTYRMMYIAAQDFPDSTILGARYLPGFQTDLTSWTLTIDVTGRLSQTLDTFESIPKRARRAVIQLDEALVMEWITQVDALDFLALQTTEESISIDDSSSYTLMCHFEPVHKFITLRTLDWFVMHEHPEMITFRALWDAIHALAPFPQTRRSWSDSR